MVATMVARMVVVFMLDGFLLLLFSTLEIGMDLGFFLTRL